MAKQALLQHSYANVTLLSRGLDESGGLSILIETLLEAADAGTF